MTTLTGLLWHYMWLRRLWTSIVNRTFSFCSFWWCWLFTRQEGIGGGLGGNFLKGFGPTWGYCQQAPLHCQGTFAFLSPRLLWANGGEGPPLTEKLRWAAINPPTACSELRITQETLLTTTQPFLRSDKHAYAWIITMTLEEIRGQENTMDNTDR